MHTLWFIKLLDSGVIPEEVIGFSETLVPRLFLHHPRL